MTRGGLSRHRRQRGLSLLFALLALAAISLAAVALVRSVDTGSVVIGNLGFKQDATAAAGQAAEQAIGWLVAHAGTDLHNDNVAVGYYASSLDALDVTGSGSSSATRAVVDWGADGCSAYAKVGFAACLTPSPEIVLNGGANRARFVIARLCAAEGSPAVVDCAFPFTSAFSSGGNKGVVDYKAGKAMLAMSSQQYYRIVVRAQSARGTVSFTETIVQL